MTCWGNRAYYAVPGNRAAVAAFRTQVTRHWHAALERRSQRTLGSVRGAARKGGPYRDSGNGPPGQ